MPNHVRNELYFECDDEERIMEMMNTIKGEDSPIDFEKIIPMPSNIFRGNLGQKEKELYGKNNWYDWSVANWGTKWNAYEGNEMYRWRKGRLLYEGVSFLTAWSAPFPILLKLSEMFSDVTITHYYADEDIGYNCGKFVYKNGIKEDMTEFGDGSDEATRFACDVWGYDYDEYLEEIEM